MRSVMKRFTRCNTSFNTLKTRKQCIQQFWMVTWFCNKFQFVDSIVTYISIDQKRWLKEGWVVNEWMNEWMNKWMNILTNALKLSEMMIMPKILMITTMTQRSCCTLLHPINHQCEDYKLIKVFNTWYQFFLLQLAAIKTTKTKKKRSLKVERCGNSWWVWLLSKWNEHKGISWYWKYCLTFVFFYQCVLYEIERTFSIVTFLY